MATIVSTAPAPEPYSGIIVTLDELAANGPRGEEDLRITRGSGTPRDITVSGPFRAFLIQQGTYAGVIAGDTTDLYLDMATGNNNVTVRSSDNEVAGVYVRRTNVAYPGPPAPSADGARLGNMQLSPYWTFAPPSIAALDQVGELRYRPAIAAQSGETVRRIVQAAGRGEVAQQMTFDSTNTNYVGALGATINGTFQLLHGWVVPLGVALQFDATLTPLGANRFLHQLYVGSEGAIRLRIRETAGGGDTTANNDLVAAFEIGGSVTIASSAGVLRIPFAGEDSAETYQFYPGNQDEVAAYADALPSQSGDLDATVTFAVPNAQYNLYDDSAAADITRLAVNYTAGDSLTLTATRAAGFSLSNKRVYLADTRGNIASLATGAGPWVISDSHDAWQIITNLQDGDDLLIVVGNAASIAAAPWQTQCVPAGVTEQTITELTNLLTYLIQVGARDGGALGMYAGVFAAPQLPGMPSAPPAPDVANRHSGARITFEIPVADQVEEVDIEYRATDTMMGMEMGYQPIVQKSSARTYEADLPNAQRAELRLKSRNAGGVMAGPSTVIRKVGEAQGGGALPATLANPDTGRRWYESDPGGPGDLYRTQEELITLPSGPKFWGSDVPIRIPQLGDTDIERLQEWRLGVYEAGAQVVVTRVVTIGEATVRTRDVYLCLRDHEAVAQSDHPANAPDKWELSYQGLTTEDPLVNVTPEEADPGAANITTGGIVPTKTLLFNRMVGTAGVPPNERGQYKLGTKRGGSWVQLNAWQDVKLRVDTVTVSLCSLAAAVPVPPAFCAPDWDTYCASVGGAVNPGKLVVKYSDGKWVRYAIIAARPSYNGLRCTFTVVPEAFRETDGTADIALDAIVPVSFLWTVPDVLETAA